MSPEERLKELGIELPDAPEPLGSYIPSVRSGNLLFLSGILPMKSGSLAATGKVGEGGLSPEEANELARLCTINAMSILKASVGDLGKVARCVKVTGYVASMTDFTAQPGVINGASNLLAEVFGESGRHARAAVGVNVLPLDSPVEIEFIFEIKP